MTIERVQAPAATSVSVNGQDLSAEARLVAEGLDALLPALPQPPAIVQLLVFNGGLVTASVDSGGQVVEYRSQGGEIASPKPVDTSYLDCTTGLAEGEIDFAALPALWDDAPRRAGSPDKGTLQIVVARHPCSTAWINVAVEGPASVQYDGRGKPINTRDQQGRVSSFGLRITDR